MTAFNIDGTVAHVVGLTVVIITAIFLAVKHRAERLKETLPPETAITLRHFIDVFISGQMHRLHISMFDECGPVYRLPIKTWNSVFVVHDPTVARIIMEGDIVHSIPECEKSVRYKMMEKLTNGVATMLTKKTHDKSWEISRKAVSPSFSMMNLNKVLPELQSKLDEFNTILDAHVSQDKTLIDLPKWMIRLTVDVLAASMFDTDFRTLKSHCRENLDSSNLDKREMTNVESDGELFIQSLDIVARECMMRAPLQPWRKYLFWNKQVMKEIADAERAVEAIEGIGQRVLEGYRAKHTEADLMENTSILAHLIRSPYKTERDRIADVSVFMMAGHDTTAYQLSWIIIELSRHPAVVAKLRLELDSLFSTRQDSSVVFTPQHLSKLDYLTSVIKEGMRLWPVAAIGTSRILAADIQFGLKTIPKGSAATIGFFAMFRNGIREPNAFLPERWIDTDPDAARLKEMNFPFSLGKRACVGQTLALLEMKLVLATLFYSYDFELVSEVGEMYYITLKPQNANFKITARK